VSGDECYRVDKVTTLHDCCCLIAGLLDESSGAAEVEVITSSRTRIILSRLAVLVGVLAVVGVLVAIRLFVHITVTDQALLCLPTTSSATSLDYSVLHTNTTLPPCNETVSVHLPPTVWSAYVQI